MSRQFLAEFIDEYRRLPCLWRVVSREYRDRNMKINAYYHLLNKMREAVEEPTIQTVKNKINSIRGSFRKELKRIKESQESGAAEEDVYKPRLWYFNHLLFLYNQEAPRENVSSVDLENNSIVPQVHLDVPETDIISELLADIEDVSTSTMPTPALFVNSNMVLTHRSNLKRKRNAAEELLEKLSMQLDAQKEDKYSVIGKTIANTLRELPNETSLVTEKIINEILFQAQMGNVTRSTNFNLQDTCTYVPIDQLKPALPQHPQNNVGQYYSNFGDCLSNTY